MSILKTAAAMFVAALFAPAAHAADESRRLDELDAVCFKAREAKLREVQRQKIEECVREPPPPREAAKSRQECEKY